MVGFIITWNDVIISESKHTHHHQVSRGRLFFQFALYDTRIVSLVAFVHVRDDQIWFIKRNSRNRTKRVKAVRSRFPRRCWTSWTLNYKVAPPSEGELPVAFHPRGPDSGRGVCLHSALEAHVGSTDDFHALWFRNNYSGLLKEEMTKVTWPDFTFLSSSVTQFFFSPTPTFDLHSYLAFFSSCHVADHTQVSSLVLRPNLFDLQSPVSVDLVAVALKVPLAVTRPVWTNPRDTAMHTSTYTHIHMHTPTETSLSFSLLSNTHRPHHLRSGTGEPKKRQSKKVFVPSVTMMCSFLGQRIRGVASRNLKKTKIKWWVIVNKYLPNFAVFWSNHAVEVHSQHVERG